MLGDIADTASKSPEVEIFIEGHTDAAGNAKHNAKLSKLRATTIKNYFIGNGIHPSKIHARGMGSRNPGSPWQVPPPSPWTPSSPFPWG